MKKFLFLVVIMIMATSSYAAACSVSPGITSGFDTILNTYASIATTWSSQILPYATKLFWLLFSLEFLYQLTFKKILVMDVQKLYVFFVVRIFTAYMFAQIFLDVGFYQGIITYFTNLGSTLGGSSITLSSGASGMAVSPSSIMNYLECEYAIPAGALAVGSFSPIGGELFAMLLFAVLVLIISIPVALMITMIDAYVVIFGGFILCGFSGSSWTQNYWQKYLSYVGGVAIRLFVTCLILGLVIQSFSVLNNLTIPTLTIRGISTSIPDPAGMATFIEAMFGLLFFNVIAMVTIPNKVAGMLSGSINGGLGEVIGGASMMMAGMRGFSGLSGAAGTFGSGVFGAPAAGKTAAIGKARELLGNGAGGQDSTPSAADWKTQAKNTGITASNQHMKGAWSSAKSQLTGDSSTGNKGALSHLGAGAFEAGKMSGSHAGASELNVNAHKE